MPRDFEIEWQFAGKGGAFQTKNVSDVCAAAKRGVKELVESLSKRAGTVGDLNVDYPGGAFQALNTTDIVAASKRAAVQILDKCCPGDEVGAVEIGERLTPYLLKVDICKEIDRWVKDQQIAEGTPLDSDDLGSILDLISHSVMKISARKYGKVGEVVGWTIGKIPEEKISAVIAHMGMHKGYTIESIADLVDLSIRDTAGVISYVMSTGRATGPKEWKQKWSKEVFNRAKVGQVNKGYIISRDKEGENRTPEGDARKATEKGLMEGEGVAVTEILELLHFFMTTEERTEQAEYGYVSDRVKAGSIAVDELEKYFSRDGEVGKISTPIMQMAGYPVARKAVEIMKKKGIFTAIEKELAGE